MKIVTVVGARPLLKVGGEAQFVVRKTHNFERPRAGISAVQESNRA